MKAFCVGFFAGVSHTVLDAMTSGGLGVAALWPFDQGRHFLPWRPISVSPIGPRSFFTQRGVAALSSGRMPGVRGTAHFKSKKQKCVNFYAVML